MFYRDAAPTPEIIMARLCLLLHQTPEAIRHMSMEEVDAILYMTKCENHKQQEDARINQEKSNFKP